MSQLKRPSVLVTAIAIGLLTSMVGCTAPSLRRGAAILCSVPPGTSRVEVYKSLGRDFTKVRSNPGYGGYFPPAGLLTEQTRQDELNCVDVFKTHGSYVAVYPTNLFDMLPDKVYWDGLIVREAYIGGSFHIYYDANTNYIGFVGLAP